MAEQTLTVQDVSLLEKFKAKAAEFTQAFTSLVNMDTSALTPEQKDEYLSLRSTGDNIYSTIDWITSSVDNVTGFFSDFFNFDGIGAVREYINEPEQQLGIIPLIPIAAISGALAIMAKFAKDVYLFERKITEQNRLIAGGVPPAQAAEIIKKIGGNTFLETAKDIIKPVSIAFVLWLAYRFYNQWKQS